MRTFEVARTVDASAAAAWALLVDVREWPRWGPSVRTASIDGGGHRIVEGATGAIVTVAGVSLPFRITEWEDGRRWGWRVASIPATTHHVRPIGANRCEVVFGVPWLAAPYALVCRSALARIAELLEG